MARKNISFTIRKPQVVPYLRTLIMGQPGVGKTRFLGTMGIKTLVVDFEGGCDAVLPINDYIDVVEAKDSQTYQDIYEFLMKGDHDYEAVAIDSLSATNTHFFREIREQETNRNDRRSDTNRAELSDWNLLQNQTETMIDAFRLLQMHVLMTAHVIKVQDQVYGHRYVPYLQPTKMPTRALAVMNETIYLSMHPKTGERFLLLNNNPRFSCKCRVREGIDLPDQIPNPTFDKFYAALRGEYTGETGENFPVPGADIEHDD